MYHLFEQYRFGRIVGIYLLGGGDQSKKASGDVAFRKQFVASGLKVDMRIIKIISLRFNCTDGLESQAFEANLGTFLNDMCTVQL